MSYIATFHPQQSVGRKGDCYPIDPLGETQWDCSEFFMSDAFTDIERDEVLNDPWGSYTSDRVRDDPTAPRWAKDWDGPFEVTVHNTEEVDSLE